MLKMPTIVGILTFISRINTISERFEARKSFIYQYPRFYEHSKLNFMISLAEHENSYPFGPVAGKLIFLSTHVVNYNIMIAEVIC